MEKPIKKHPSELGARSEMLLSGSDNSESITEWNMSFQELNANIQSIEWETLTQESSYSKQTTCSEIPIDENNDIKNISDQSLFALLPEDLTVHILLGLDLKCFFALLRTDSIRESVCSENLIRRFLSEKRYKENLPKHIPVCSDTFPIEGQTKMLDITILLITAANAGYVEDFRILLNRQCITKKDAYAILVTAVLSEQIGIVKQLMSHKVIKENFTLQELQRIVELTDNNKKIKKLMKKQGGSRCIIS